MAAASRASRASAATRAPPRCGDGRWRAQRGERWPCVRADPGRTRALHNTPVHVPERDSIAKGVVAHQENVRVLLWGVCASFTEEDDSCEAVPKLRDLLLEPRPLPLPRVVIDSYKCCDGSCELRAWGDFLRAHMGSSRTLGAASSTAEPQRCTMADRLALPSPPPRSCTTLRSTGWRARSLSSASFNSSSSMRGPRSFMRSAHCTRL